MDKDIRKLFEFMQLLQNMKENKRWKNTPTVHKKESIADHSWKALVMAYTVGMQLGLEMDFFKMMKLVLVHDLVEAVAGDTDYTLIYLGLSTKEDKHRRETEAIKEISKILPDSIGQEVFDLWSEYEDWSTKEAIFAKLIEKIESIDHMLRHGQEFVDIPDKFAGYCRNALLKCPEMRGFYAGYAAKLKELYDKAGFEWKDSYEVEGEYEPFDDFEMFYGFFGLAQKLKDTERYGSSPLITKKDTVAEHSYRLAFMAFISKELNEGIDLERAIYISLFHDLVEAVAGEVDYILIHTGVIKKEDKHQNELQAIQAIEKMLPEKIGRKIRGFWEEFEDCKTPEANYIKALDKYESISHLLFHTHENFDEPDLIATYCDRSMSRAPEFNQLYKLLKTHLKAEYMKWGEDWKEEYDIV